MEEAEPNNLLNYLDLDENSTLQKKAEFLAHFSGTCNITKSAKAVGIDRSTVYWWKKHDDQFVLDLDDAKEIAVEALEDEMHRRAMDGVLKINKYGTYREYSDTLAIFLAKAHKPDRYNERIRNEITGPGGAPLNMDDNKIALKLDAILKSAMQRKAAAETPKQEEADEDEDFDDLC